MPYLTGSVLSFIITLFESVAAKLEDTLDVFIASDEIRPIEGQFYTFSTLDELHAIPAYKSEEKDITVVTDWFSFPDLDGLNTERLLNLKNNPGIIYPFADVSGGSFGYIDRMDSSEVSTEQQHNVIEHLDSINLLYITSLYAELFAKGTDTQPFGSNNLICSDLYHDKCVMNKSKVYGPSYVNDSTIEDSTLVTVSTVIKSLITKSTLMRSVVVNSDIANSKLEGCIVVGSIIENKELAYGSVIINGTILK